MLVSWWTDSARVDIVVLNNVVTFACGSRWSQACSSIGRRAPGSGQDEVGLLHAGFPNVRRAALTAELHRRSSPISYLERLLPCKSTPGGDAGLSAELFSGVLTLAVATWLWSPGPLAWRLVLIAIALLIFQYLVGELLKSKQRGEELHRRATTMSSPVCQIARCSARSSTIESPRRSPAMKASG